MADIVIIGGGVTGLSAGIHLLESGERHRVVICEAHTRPGGNLTGWKREGCQIDNCIHWLNGTAPTTPLYREWCRLGALGEDVEIRRRDSLYTCRLGDDELTLWRELGRVERAMLWYAPGDKREIRRLFRAVRELQKRSGLDVSDFRRSGLSALAFYAHMTTGELADRFSHPLLRQFLTAICDRDFAALAQLEIMAHFCGGNADLPAGGSAAMAERMAARFCALGGILRTGTTAERVEYEQTNHTRDSRICAVWVRQGERRSRIPAEYVIVTADPAVACEQLLKRPLPTGLARRYAQASPQNGMRFSALQAAFSCPRKRLNFSGDLILPFPTAEVGCPHTGSVLLREFSHEPNFAPVGEVVVQAMTFCDEAAARRILSLPRPAYDAFKQQLAATFGRILEAACPTVRGAGDIRFLDAWTPATYRRFTGSQIGSFMSFTLTPRGLLRDGAAGLLEKLHLSTGEVLGVDNVLLAGQWLRAPGGLPIAAGEGRRAARTAERFLREREHIHVRLARVGAK